MSQYNLRHIEQKGWIIGVNDAALYTRADIAITRDRLWFESRVDLLRTLGIPQTWVHADIVKDSALPVKRYISAYAVEDITETKLYDSNSGSAALSLAYILKPRRVFLLGFDMQRGPNDQKHWYPDYPWGYTTKPGKFKTWAEEFADFAKIFARQNIEVFNVNHRSAVKFFPTIDFNQFRAMT